MSSSSQELTTASSSNIYIYTALTVLTIAVIYILYKQTTSNQASDDAIKAASVAAATSATQNAGYETQSDFTNTLNTLIKNTGDNTVTVPATGGLYYTLPAYGFFYSNDSRSDGLIYWNFTETSSKVSVNQTNKQIVNFEKIGLYEITLSGNIEPPNSSPTVTTVYVNNQQYPDSNARYYNYSNNIQGSVLSISWTFLVDISSINSEMYFRNSNMKNNPTLWLYLTVKYISV